MVKRVVAEQDLDGIKHFCQELTDSGVLDGDAIRATFGALDEAHRPTDADGLGAELVRGGKLSAYQLQCIKAGKIDRLTLGHYTIVDRISEGGMGQVLKARHARMQRTVAIKIISDKVLGSDDALSRFEQEVRAAARLSHPNIVTAYDAGEAHGTHYLVLEYVEGEDLGTCVQRQGPLAIDAVVHFMRQAARGLAYAHDEGIIHRDVKPANLLVDNQGTAKILDMGLATALQPSGGLEETTDVRLTQQGQVMGTCAYMAPEQAVDVLSADARSDVYSLGCTMFELLVGHPPYQASTMMGIIVAHREQPVPSLRTLRSEVPEELDSIFAKMVAKQPEDRYSTMREVITALESVPADWSSAPTTDLATATAGETPATRPPRRAAYVDTVGEIAAETDTIVSRRVQKKRKSNSQLPIWIGAGVFAIFAAWAASVTLNTPEGTLLVESADPDVKIEISKGGNVVDVVDAGDDWQIRLEEGKYKVSVKGGDDKVKIDRQTVTVKHGKVQRLKVTFKPKPKPKPDVDVKRDTAQPKPKPTSQSTDVAAKPKPAPAKQTRPVVRRRPPRAADTQLFVDAKAKLEPLHTMFGHSSWLQGLAFSSDGKLLASCGIDGRVAVWDVASGAKKIHISGFAQRVSDVAFAPDGKTIAMVGDDKKAAIYDVATGKPLHVLCETKGAIKGNVIRIVMSAAYSPSGGVLLTGNNDGEIQVWDPKTGKEKTELTDHFDDVWAITYSRDGKRFASCSWDGTARIWDAATFKLLHTINEPSSVVYGIAFSKNGKRLYTAGNSTKVFEWDVKTGKQLRVIGGNGGVIISLSCSADGKLLVTTSSTDGTMRFFDTETGADAGVLRGSHAASLASFSTIDPTLLATGSNDKTVRLWRYNGFDKGAPDFLSTADDGTVTISQEVGDDHVLIPPWQSFKAPVTGKLTVVELRPNLYGGKTGALSIYAGEGNGGQQLHTQSHQSKSISGMSWQTYSLENPVAVVKDQTYTWEFTGAGGLKYSKANRYPHGGAAGGSRDMCFRLRFTPDTGMGGERSTQ